MRTIHSPLRSRLTTMTMIAAVLLLAAGASVTSTGSGLAVPDWPLSFGTAFPRMTGGVVFEHGHRMIAGVVALLVVAMTAVILRGEVRAWVRRWSLAVCAMVLVQAVLGGMTVLLKLPALVSVAHAGLAQAVFAVLTLLATVSARRWTEHTTPASSITGDLRIGRLAIAALALVYAQILVGAVVRHTGSGLIFADFPLSGGRLVPLLTHPSMAIQFAHRVGAVVVALSVVGIAITAMRSPDVSRRVRGACMHAMGIVCVQFLLGATAIWTRLTPVVTILHVACGALLLGSLVSLVLWGRHTALSASAPGTGRAWIAGRRIPHVRAAASAGSLPR